MVCVEITQDDSITLGLGEELEGGGEVRGNDEIGGMYMLYMCMGMLLMVAVMAKCSVVWSVGKRWSEGRGV